MFAKSAQVVRTYFYLAQQYVLITVHDKVFFFFFFLVCKQILFAGRNLLYSRVPEVMEKGGKSLNLKKKWKTRILKSDVFKIMEDAWNLKFL